jgi:hypothetical protein
MRRREFLAGVGGALGAAMAGSHLPRLAFASSTPNGRAPTRLLIIHKPCGTVPDQYDCTGGETDFTLSPLLAAYQGLRPRMVILEGLDIRKKDNTPGQDHGNAMVTFMTGGVTIRADGESTVTADRASIDYLLAQQDSVVGDAPVRGLQLAADIRTHDFFTSILTYAGRGAPLQPETRPLAVYLRLFGALMDGGNTPANQAALAQARKRKHSVLDYSRQSLQRLNQRAGSQDRERLDRHLEAVREMELLLDRSLACPGTRDLASSVSAIDMSRIDDLHGVIGRAHLDLVRTAFQCDLTRIATFGWAVGPAYVNLYNLVPGTENLAYHVITHNGSNRAHDETAINLWYSQQMASFLLSMRDTPDSDGNSLLDNTLVVVWSEMHLSSHTFDNVPIQLFGGAGGRLQGNRLLNFGGRSTNDLWVTIANALGVPMNVFGDPERCQGTLPGLFS